MRPRTPEIKGEFAIVRLTKGEVCIVDSDIAEFIGQWNWCVSDGRSGKIYAKRGCKGKTIRMHRQIMNAKDGEEVDHIDGDSLNNRRSNLRIVTMKQNKYNSRMRSPKSKLKGAYWHKNRQKWQSNIGVDGKTIYLGLFDTPEDAHSAYKRASEKYHGQYGRVK